MSPSKAPDAPSVITYAGAPVDVSAKLNSRKRSRVMPPERRKKVAQACDLCKKRKQKCDGLQPCNLCLQRDLKCLYTAIDRRLLKPSKKELQGNKHNAARDIAAWSASPSTKDSSASAATSTEQVALPVASPVGPVPAEAAHTNGSVSAQSAQSAPQTSSSSSTTHAETQYPQYMWTQVDPSPAAQRPSSPHFGALPYKQVISPPAYPLPPITQMAQPPLQGYPLYMGQPIYVSSGFGPQGTGPPTPRPNVIQELSRNEAPPPQQRLDQQGQSRAEGQEGQKTQHDQVSVRRNSKQVQSASQIPASLQPLLPFRLTLHPNEVNDESYNQYMIPCGSDNNWRILFDKAGNLRYLGESSCAAYLLQCRKVFGRVLGPQKFSDDPDRYIYVDSPGLALETRDPKLPERDYTDYLISTYLNNLNNVLYIVDRDSLLHVVAKVYSNDFDKVAQKDTCIFFLVLSLASIFAQSELDRNIFPFAPEKLTPPQEFFEISMTIVNHTTEDDNIWLAEAYLLMFFFYQFKGHKNTAWVKLGVGIRYALGLGLNRTFVNESFKDPKFVLHRRKLFRSFFIMDTLSSVYMGRSMTLRVQDWDDIKSVDALDDFQKKLLKVCLLNAKILERVYFNPQISLKEALGIASELKIYALKNPINSVSQGDSPTPVDHKLLLPHAIYLHGIILLSRPFFHFVALKKLGIVQYDPDSKNSVHLQNFYHSCIKASLLIVKIVEFCYHQNVHPFKPLALVSNTFHAGLVLGLLLLMKAKGIDHEMFKDDPSVRADPNAMLSAAVSSVVKVLKHYGRVDQQADRYATILQYLMEVTNTESNCSDEVNVSPTTSHEKVSSTLQNFDNILRFQDWLFPKDQAHHGIDDIPGSGNNEDFLKDIAGLNNVDASGTQFLDDFFYNVMDAGTSNAGQTKHANGGAD